MCSWDIQVVLQHFSLNAEHLLPRKFKRLPHVLSEAGSWKLNEQKRGIIVIWTEIYSMLTMSLTPCNILHTLAIFITTCGVVITYPLSSLENKYVDKQCLKNIPILDFFVWNKYILRFVLKICLCVYLGDVCVSAGESLGIGVTARCNSVQCRCRELSMGLLQEQCML